MEKVRGADSVVGCDAGEWLLDEVITLLQDRDIHTLNQVGDPMSTDI